MRFFIFIAIFSAIPLYAQDSWDDLSGPQKAFFYNVSRRTEILKEGVFHLFEFTDSIPMINDTLPNYKYVEKQIANSPDKLHLYQSEMRHKPNGLIADLAVHFAVWELNQVLQYRKSTDDKDKWIHEEFAKFQLHVLQDAPQAAIRTLKDGTYQLHKSLDQFYGASLTVFDKLAAMKNSSYAQLDQLLCLNAISNAYEKYVQARSKEIFVLLGGEEEEFLNLLSAAGDGRDFSSLEDTYKGNPMTRALPNERGVFDFEVYEKTPAAKMGEEQKDIKKVLAIRDVRTHQFTMDPAQETVVHFNVYAFHPKRQTTISIQKGGAAYVLYGKNEHRLLSPDSTYGEGTTYHRLMHKLEHFYIADLEEKLYGKRGYKYWIEEYEQKIQRTLLSIQKTEYRIDKLRHTPQGPPKIKKKKRKKKNSGLSDQAGQGHPTDKLTKTQKKQNIEQNRLVQLTSQLEGEKAMLEKLKKEYEEAFFILKSYRTKLDKMQKTLGLLMMEYTVEGDVYTFSDGASFNYRTQDFSFPSDGHPTPFTVNHICFGKEVFTEAIDENFIHINRTVNESDEKYIYHRLIRDRDQVDPNNIADSIQSMEILKALLKEDVGLTMTALAGGIKVESEGQFTRNKNESPEPYNEVSKQNEGVTVYHGDWGANVDLTVQVWEDQMIPFEFTYYQDDCEKFKSKNPDLNEVDFWTSIRAQHAARSWITLLQIRAEKWIEDPKDQATIKKKLKKVKVKKVGFKEGTVEAKVPTMEVLNK